MFAVVFEVQPQAGKTEDYLDLAQLLRGKLEATDGFISVERFRSRRRPGWMLSLSIWRDEKSVVRWRSQGDHHAIQLQGRAHVFSDYHLRVGEIMTDSQPSSLRQQRLDETEVGAAKALGITEITATDGRAIANDVEAVASHAGLRLGSDALVDHDVFESLHDRGKLALLTSWRTAADAIAWTPSEIGEASRHRTIRSVRDYALFDRREAPPFCPIVQRRTRGPATEG